VLQAVPPERQAAWRYSQRHFHGLAAAQAAGRHVRHGEKGEVGAGGAGGIGIEQVVCVGHILVDRACNQAQAQHTCVKIQVFLGFIGDAGDMMDAMNRAQWMTSLSHPT
jgi:hypothetical protein